MKNKHDQSIENEKQTNFLGCTPYPASEDILNKQPERLDINVERIGESKEENEINPIIDDGLYDSNLESDLDIPGAELDDVDEAIGSEDEENNFYSESDTD